MSKQIIKNIKLEFLTDDSCEDVDRLEPGEYGLNIICHDETSVGFTMRKARTDKLYHGRMPLDQIKKINKNTGTYGERELYKVTIDENLNATFMFIPLKHMTQEEINSRLQYYKREFGNV